MANTPSTRIPFMGELKHNSGTFYQFSNYANSYIDGKITPTYYIALDLPMPNAKALVKNGVAISGEHIFESPNKSQSIASPNSALSELLMKYYEAKIGTVLACEQGKSSKYFESYLIDTFFNYISDTKQTTTYLDTDIDTTDEATNGQITIDGVAYPFDSDSDRALIKIVDSPIKYIGKINCQGYHEFNNRSYTDLHINIPSVHNTLNGIMPVKLTSDEVELNRKKIADVTCKCEVTTEVPYMTATGHVDDTTTIQDTKDGYFYYKNIDIIKNNTTKYTSDSQDTRYKKLLVENNIKIDYDYLIENYKQFAVEHDTPTTIEFNTVAIIGLDENGCAVPCGVYFCSHYDDMNTPSLVAPATKIDSSRDGDDGAEYSLRLSTGMQVMQNVTEIYEHTDSNSTTNDIGELTSMSARLSSLADALRDDLQMSGKWSGQLTSLIGNAYTIRRNVPYLVDYTTGTDKVKVWYVNGMNTGVCADGTLLSNTKNNSNIEEDIKEKEDDAMFRAYKEDCAIHVDSATLTIPELSTSSDNKITLSNIYLPDGALMNDHDNIMLVEPFVVDATFQKLVLNAMPYAIAAIMNNNIAEYNDIEEDEFFSIYYKLKNDEGKRWCHVTLSYDNTSGFYPVLEYNAYDGDSTGTRPTIS